VFRESLQPVTYRAIADVTEECSPGELDRAIRVDARRRNPRFHICPREKLSRLLLTGRFGERLSFREAAKHVAPIGAGRGALSVLPQPLSAPLEVPGVLRFL